MFLIQDDLSIHITRGDIGVVEVAANKGSNEPYMFQPGDVIRLRVYPKRHHENIVLLKDVLVESETSIVPISLARNDTKLGGIIDKPTIYWYEIELNPDVSPQTIVGYDQTGPKLFTLYPEGGDAEYV